MAFETVVLFGQGLGRVGINSGMGRTIAINEMAVAPNKAVRDEIFMASMLLSERLTELI
jgi:hypothetical protein